MVFFSSFVSSITHAMTNLRSIHVRKIEQEMFMAKYFSEFRISRELASRCRHFITQHQRMASRRIKGTDIPFSNILPKFINEDLRCEALIPFLKAHPFFDFYMVICPVGMRQICCNATEEISMLPQEELFWNGQPVNRMFFVRVGSVFYTDDNTDIPTLEVKVGQWACEETLWSKVSLVSKPFTASTLGCEMITVLPAEFQMISKMHPYPLRFCVNYAKLFINAFNCASKDIAYRNLLFNDSRECTNLVFHACVGLDDQGKLKKHFGTKLGLMNSILRIAAAGEDETSQTTLARDRVNLADASWPLRTFEAQLRFCRRPLLFCGFFPNCMLSKSAGWIADEAEHHDVPTTCRSDQAVQQAQVAIMEAVGRITKMSKHLRAKTTIPEAVVAKLEALFKLCDKDNKGYVTIEEDRKLTEAMGFTYDETCKAHFRSPEDGSEPRVSMKEWVNYFRLAILQAMVEKACTLDQTEGIVDQMRADVEKNTPAAGAG
ncbi:unnamed protein product [Prorocentrum cordatum]|uniref:EF-hand domain-containing protein n=1 Tax=Prorocentrum cordatum TaxID=2364126 RepID=A0ABN9R8S5_9DINO|nr:unnamed protein product [Polarella glacialis]